mgnify:CR=1 FL=1|jgi:hypothetical protein
MPNVRLDILFRILLAFEEIRLYFCMYFTNPKFIKSVF